MEVGVRVRVMVRFSPKPNPALPLTLPRLNPRPQQVVTTVGSQ